MLLKNIFFSSISLTLRFLSNTVIYIILARAFGVKEFGTFSFALSFTGIFLIFIDYGFNLLIVKEIAQDSDKIIDFSESIVNAKAILTIIFTLIILIILRLMFNKLNTILIVVILWVSVVFYSFGTFFNNIFKGLNKFEYETYPTILLNIIQFILIIIFLLLNLNSYYVAIAYLIARICFFIYSYHLLCSKIAVIRLKLNLKDAVRVLKNALPYGIHAILAILYFQIDTVFLSYFKGDIDVGYYQAGMRILMASMIIYDIFLSVYFPILAKNYNLGLNFKENAITFNKFMLFFGGVISIFLYIFSDFTIDILYGKEYQPASLVLRLLSIIIVLRFVASVYAVILTISENQNLRVLIVAISLTVNILFNIFLIPKYGVIGTAVSNILTHLSLLFFCVFFAVKKTHNMYIDNEYINLILLLNIVILLTYFIKTINIYFSVLFFIIITCVVFWLILKIEAKKTIIKHLSILLQKIKI